MKKITLLDFHKNRTRKTKRWLGWLTFCMMVFGQMSFAQIDYTYDWEPTGMGSWTTSGSGSFSRQTVTPCSGSASARANNYFGYESFLVSPALTGTNGGDLTVSFNYKVTDYYSNGTGASAANFGEVRVEWDSSTSGPWAVVYTITSTEHIVSSSCANKSVTFSGLPSSGDVYVRFVAMSGNSSADNYAYFDDVVITQGPPPTCPAPSALTASNPTLTSIDLSWNGVGGASGNYEIKWGTTGFDIDAATAIPVTGLTYTLNGTGGNYAFVVREICDTNDESSWSAPYSFSIPNIGEDCSAPIVIGALPYTTTDDTANYTDNPNIEGSPGSSGCGTTSSYLNGNDVVYAYTAAFDDVISVQLTELTATYSGIFAYASCADIGVACIGSAFGSGATDRGFEMNVADGDTYYFVISTWASPQTVGYTLDISQVLCPKPTGVAHTDVTHNSANVSWDVSGDYEINWGTGTFTAGDGDNTDTVNNTTEFAFSGLNGTTTYRYFVRQNCGGTDGDSEWVGPFTFTTLVAPASIPWMEGFTTTTIPTGWAQTGFSFGVVTAITNAPGGVEGNVIYKNLWSSATSGNFQTIRIGTVSAGDILSFIHKTHNFGDPYAPPAANSGNFIVAISTDNGANYTNIQTITNDGVSEGWQNFEYDLSGYDGEYVRIRISATRTAGDYYLAFDNFYVGQPITCEAPTALTATNITTNTADLSWTSEGSTFDISWGTGTFDAEDGTIVSLANGGTLSGLTPQTTYQYYVRQNCGGGDLSAWAGPFSFTTLCVPVAVLPYTENFDTYGTGSNAFPDCWERPVTYTSGSVWPSIIGVSGNSSPNSLRFQSAVGTPTYAVSPAFAEDIHNLRVKFNLRKEGSNSGSIDIGVMSDPFDLNSFELIQTINPTETTFIEYTINLNNTTLSGSNNYIAFRHNSNANNWYYWLDDFVVELLPSCIEPSALTATNLTYSSADLSWTSDGEQFDIKWGTPGFDVEEEGTLAEDFVSGATLSGLDAETTYEFYVRQNCGEEMSDWAGPYSFYTGYCVPATTSGTSYGITGVSTSGGYTNISNLNSGFTSGGYSDQTVFSVSQSPGEQINYSVNVPSYTILEIWIDLNQNLVFDTEELVANHAYSTSATTFNGVLYIPEELSIGEYRIRVRSRNYWNTTANPCGVVQGETEDYTLSVVAPPTCFPPTGLTAVPTHNSAVLGWTSDGEQFDIKWG